MTDVSILVLAKNEGANIRDCLSSVFSQKFDGTFEVILVDSGSTDKTLEVAAKFNTRIEQIPPTSFHHARTRNYAASLAQGEILVYLAADATPASPTWLRSLITNFEDPLVGAVYGKHVPRLGTSRERQDTLDTLYGEKRIVKERSNKKVLGYRFYLMSTVNAAVRKTTWQQIPFPEHLKVFEDIGIAKELLENDWKIVYEPGAAVYHSHNHTAVELLKRYFDLGFTFRRLGLWNGETRASMISDFGKLVRRKLNPADRKKRGIRQSSGTHINKEFAKTIGLFLGLHEHYLPRALKRRLSAFHVFG